VASNSAKGVLDCEDKWIGTGDNSDCLWHLDSSLSRAAEMAGGNRSYCAWCTSYLKEVMLCH
jgi:hypothetical protein